MDKAKVDTDKEYLIPVVTAGAAAAAVYPFVPVYTEYKDYDGTMLMECTNPRVDYDSLSTINAAYSSSYPQIKTFEISEQNSKCAGWTITYNDDVVYRQTYDPLVVATLTTEQLAMDPTAEWINSVKVYTDTASVGGVEEFPAIVFTTNLGNSISCGDPSIPVDSPDTHLR